MHFTSSAGRLIADHSGTLAVDRAEARKRADTSEIVPVQDGQREKDLAALFGLTRGNSRIGVDAHDRHGNPFELKTTSKGGVSTARDVGPHTLAKWSSRYWLIARGKNFATGFRFERVFFMAPQHLAGWIDTLRARFASDAAIIDKARAPLTGTLSPEEMERVQYIFKRGILLNDPNIPWRYVESNGIEILADHAERLSELVEQFPLSDVTPNSAVPIAADEHDADKFFVWKTSPAMTAMA